MTDRYNSIQEVVHKIESSAPFDKATVERVFQIDLIEQNSTGSFRFFEAKNVVIDSLHIGQLNYREPLPNNVSGARPLLFMTIDDECVEKGEIFIKFGPLTLTEAPRGHSVSEEAVFSRNQSWGRLSFGFPESSPNCLKTITFAPA